MSTTTTNFGLTKLEKTDPADITTINSNWDKIDSELLKAKEIYIAEYGVTTYLDVTDAFYAGKFIVCKRNNYLFLPLIQWSTGEGVFLFSDNIDNVSHRVSLSYSSGNNVWTESEINMIGFGTDDLTAGESALDTGTLYFVYE